MKPAGSWLSSVNDKGEYQRKPSSFRSFVKAADVTPGRYHLYVSLACPWAHRTLIVRKLKGLESAIGYTVVDWLLGEGGWKFVDNKPKCSLDHINNATFLREIYLKANPEYQGNITVPVLWDKEKQTIVNNESSEILRMLNSEFNHLCATEEQKALDLYPPELQAEIEELHSWIYPNINNGVYRCGFAKSQEAYDQAFDSLFEALERVEKILEGRRYLTGDRMTEADVRLFTTLVRFDVVYVGHFKTNLKRIVDYPNLWGYVRDLYNHRGIAETVDFQHIKNHYLMSHISINPLGIVPKGPLISFDELPLDRFKKFGVPIPHPK